MRLLFKSFVYRFRQRRRRSKLPAPTPSSSFCSPGSLGKLSASGSDQRYDPASMSIHALDPSKATSNEVLPVQTKNCAAAPVSTYVSRNQGADFSNVPQSLSAIPVLKKSPASSSAHTIVSGLPRTAKFALNHPREQEQLRAQVGRLQDELRSLTKSNRHLKQENEMLQSILQELGLSSDNRSQRFSQDSSVGPRSLDVYEAQLALTLKARREARRNSNVAHFWKKLAKANSHNSNVVTPSASALSEANASLSEERAIRLQELIKRRRETAVYEKTTQEIARVSNTEDNGSGALDSTLASFVISNELRNTKSSPHLTNNSMTTSTLSSESSTMLNSLWHTSSSFTLLKTHNSENLDVSLEESSTLLPYAAMPAPSHPESILSAEHSRFLLPMLSVPNTLDDQPCLPFLAHPSCKDLSVAQVEVSSTAVQLMPLISTTSTYRSITLAYLSSISSMPTLASSNEDTSTDSNLFDVASEARLLPASSSLPLIPSFGFASSTSDYSWAAQTAESSETISEYPTSTSFSSLTSSSSSSSSISIPLSILALAFPLPPITLPQRSLNKPSSAVASPDAHGFISQIELTGDEPIATEEPGDTAGLAEAKATLDVGTLSTMKSDSLGMPPVSSSLPSSLFSSTQEPAAKDKTSMRRSYPFLIPRTNLPESDVEPFLLPLLSEIVNKSSPCPP